VWIGCQGEFYRAKRGLEFEELRSVPDNSHPASVETLVALTPDIIATGSEDGLIRVMQLYPSKFRAYGCRYRDRMPC
jgi:hypothetical protein